MAFYVDFFFQNGNFVGPIIVVLLMMFSGFGVNLRDIPYLLKWGTEISFLRYGLEALVAAIYDAREILPCYEYYCHYRYPKMFLNEVAMTTDGFGKDVIALVITLLITRVVAYFMLRLRVNARVSI